MLYVLCRTHANYLCFHDCCNGRGAGEVDLKPIRPVLATSATVNIPRTTNFRFATVPIRSRRQHRGLLTPLSVLDTTLRRQLRAPA